MERQSWRRQDKQPWRLLPWLACGRWHWALQESRQSLASVLHLPCLTHRELCLLPGATSHVPCAWKRELGAKDPLSTLGCGSLPRQHSEELLRPGWLQGRLQGSCTAGKGNDQQLKPMKGKEMLHKKSHISEHAMPSKHPQSSQILALLIS